MMAAISPRVSACATAELASDFAFVEVEPKAASFESGQEVEYRWRAFLANIDEQFPELIAFIQAASYGT